ncbi:MAG: hypothetical protein EOP82_19930 [Variovorax sp.]|nr:MAG: hypothetical protein EOP82_19930 [Variovorax sp.]
MCHNNSFHRFHASHPDATDTGAFTLLNPAKETVMKLSPIIATAALSSLFAVNANAEQYRGLLQFESTTSRAEARATAACSATETLR